jgi:hypothetical protein
MGILKKGLYTLLVCFCANANAQDLDITFPSERAVFQRNNGNATIVYIAGNFRKRMDRIEAKLIPVQGGQAIDWTPIVNKASFGTYRGSLVVRGGWYQLQVRGILNGQVVAQTTLNKFGVGEVFLISGQSNAQGYFGRGQKGASDDRVNIVSNFFSEGFSKPSYPEFNHLEAESRIAPTGKGAWYWGELGDKLTQKLNVPVLFINAAWEGFPVSEFVKSSNGEKGTNPYSNNQSTPGYPFGSIMDALHYYTNLTGLRSVLWHQGESDNYLNTSFEAYSSDLTSLINKTKEQTGKNITWVIARVSKDRNRFYQPIIDAQNFVINNNPYVFAGPNTDDILDRVDGVHFSPTGFTKVAEKWSEMLSDDFFNRSSQTYGNPPMKIESVCQNEDNRNPMSLIAPLGYTKYKWNSGVENRKVTVGDGFHQGEAHDVFGNVHYTAPIKFDNSLYPQKPNINALGKTEFCQGQSVEIETNNSYWNYWNNGTEGKIIRAYGEGNYNVTHVNIYLCGAKSDDIYVKNLPAPIPKIIPSGPLDICTDEELTLKSSINNNIMWNDGSTNPQLTISNSGTYFLKALNESGCEGQSAPMIVTIKPAAMQPVIENLGSNEFCFKDSTSLKVRNNQNFKWSNDSVTELLVVKKTGIFFAINTNEFGCIAKSNMINIKVNPTPEKPTITNEGSLEVCNDETVILKTSTAEGYNWSTGHNTKEIELTNTRSVFLRTNNEFGCYSEPSDIKEVGILEIPQNPTILQSGTFTLSSLFTSDTSGIIYQWRVNDHLIETYSPFLKATESGKYTLRGKKSYILQNGKEKSCISILSEPFTYFLDESRGGFSFYPNPAPDKLITLETLENIDRATVTIFSVDGKPYFSQYVDLFDNPKTFDLKNIPFGKYVIQVRNNRSKFIGKLMVE